MVWYVLCIYGKRRGNVGSTLIITYIEDKSCNMVAVDPHHLNDW